MGPLQEILCIIFMIMNCSSGVFILHAFLSDKVVNSLSSPGNCHFKISTI